MKKSIKYISIFSIILLIAALGTFAYGQFKENVENMENESDRYVNEYDKQFKTENLSRKTIGAEKISEKANISNEVIQLSKFDQMLAVMDATIGDAEKYNNMLFNYVYLQNVNNLTQAQMDYISELVINGDEMTEIMKICYFWLDTNEDISVIGNIYDLKGEFRGKSHWIEDAFNYITNDKCGILEIEDIEFYKKQGLSTKEIDVANRLCRKGVLTIQEILERRLAGKNFVEIADEISEHTIIKSETNTPQLLKEGKTYNDIEKPMDVIISAQISEITGEEQQLYLNKAVNGENLTEILNDKINEVSCEISKKIQEQNLYKTIEKDPPKTEESREG